MDIEGVERHVLSQGTEWAARVRIILVEVHEPYDVDACCRDLAALGFDASPDDRHHAAVVGIRSTRSAGQYSLVASDPQAVPRDARRRVALEPVARRGQSRRMYP